MTVRNFNEIGVNLMPQKKVRSPASNLEQLKGFEFLEAVSGLDKAQFQTLDKSRITFIFNQLHVCIQTNTTRTRAVHVADLILDSVSNTFVDEKEALCKSLMEQSADKRVENELVDLSNRLFLNGNYLFKDFLALPAVTYGKLYEAICSKNDALVLTLLQHPLNFQEKQNDAYSLFDLTCRFLSYDVIHAFLLKNPYITSNAYQNIIFNSKLTSDNKLDLFVQLSQRGINANIEDESGNSPIHYAIKQKEVKIFNFLLSHINYSFQLKGDQLIEKVIVADFREGLNTLSNVISLKRDHFFYALTHYKLDIALLIAKKIRFKWESVTANVCVKTSSRNVLSREEIDLIVKNSSRAAYKHIEKFPSIFSMENFTLLKDLNKEHFVDLAKRVAHAWGIEINAQDPITGKTILSHGDHSMRSLLYWISFLNKLTHIPQAQELLKELKQIYHADSTDDELNLVNNRLSKNEIIVCSTGYKTHSTYAIFKRTIVLYANRGRDARKFGVSTYKAPQNAIEPSIRNVVKLQRLPRESYFSEKTMVNSFGLRLIHQTQLAAQSGSFCTLSSLKAGSFGILNLISIDPSKLTSRTAWEEAVSKNKPIYKQLTTGYRLGVLNGLLLEIEDFLQKRDNKEVYASYYYHLLLSVKLKLESSSRFSNDQKLEYGNLIKNYLNLIVDIM